MRRVIGRAIASSFRQSQVDSVNSHLTSLCKPAGDVLSMSCIPVPLPLCVSGFESASLHLLLVLRLGELQIGGKNWRRPRIKASAGPLLSTTKAAPSKGRVWYRMGMNQKGFCHNYGKLNRITSLFKISDKSLTSQVKPCIHPKTIQDNKKHFL